MKRDTGSRHERLLADFREAYAKASAKPISGPLGAHGLTILSILISLLEHGWDDASRKAIAESASSHRAGYGEKASAPLPPPKRGGRRKAPRPGRDA